VQVYTVGQLLKENMTEVSNVENGLWYENSRNSLEKRGNGSSWCYGKASRTAILRFTDSKSRSLQNCYRRTTAKRHDDGNSRRPFSITRRNDWLTRIWLIWIPYFLMQ